MAKREAMLNVMEAFGLIRRTQGAGNNPHPKCEIIS
jgi:hypothetical protein